MLTWVFVFWREIFWELDSLNYVIFFFSKYLKHFHFWYLPFCSKTFFFRREPRFLERRYLTIPCFCSEHKAKRGHGFKPPWSSFLMLLLVQSFLYHKIQSSDQLHLYKFVEGEKDFLRYFLCFFFMFCRAISKVFWVWQVNSGWDSSSSDDFRFRRHDVWSRDPTCFES